MTRTALAEFQRTATVTQNIAAIQALQGDSVTVDGQTIEFVKDLQGDYPARPAKQHGMGTLVASSDHR